MIALLSKLENKIPKDINDQTNPTIVATAI
jgi:hypothetical protein